MSALVRNSKLNGVNMGAATGAMNATKSAFDSRTATASPLPSTTVAPMGAAEAPGEQKRDRASNIMAGFLGESMGSAKRFLGM